MIINILFWTSLVCVYSTDAQTSQCETTLTNDNNLVITCQFPGSVSTLKSCDIYWTKNNDGVRLPGSVQPKDLGSSVKCELTVPVSHFGAGSHELYGTFVTKSGATTRSSPVTVNFSVPEVNLNSDCYIPWARVDNCLVGSQGYCTCDLSKPGYPPGRVSWVRSDGTSANQEASNASSKLLVTAPLPPSQVKNETFSCVWESALGKQKSTTFNVIYPIGPTTMTLRALGVGKTFDLCPGKPNEVTVVCEVPKGAVYPYPWFHFTVNGTRPVYDWFSGTLVGGVYRYNQTVKLERAGNFSVFCWPANSCTRTVPSPQQTLTLSVREPPTNFPEITINNRTYSGASLVGDALKEGATLTVSCRVSGGLPGVRDVTLTCGAQRSTSAGGAAARIPVFVARKSMTGHSCTCKASHVTGCYNKQTSVRLNVLA